MTESGYCPDTRPDFGTPEQLNAYVPSKFQLITFGRHRATVGTTAPGIVEMSLRVLRIALYEGADTQAAQRAPAQAYIRVVDIHMRMIAGRESDDLDAYFGLALSNPQYRPRRVTPVALNRSRSRSGLSVWGEAHCCECHTNELWYA